MYGVSGGKIRRYHQRITYPQNYFKSAMQDWNEVLEGTELAMNSTGSATERMETYADSLAGKINSLQSSWDSFILNLGTSDIIKNVVSLLTGFVDILNVLLNDIPILSDLIKIGLVAGALNTLFGSLVKITDLLKTGGFIGGLFKVSDLNNFIKVVKSDSVSALEIFNNTLKRTQETGAGLNGFFTLLKNNFADAAAGILGLSGAEAVATGTTVTFTGAVTALVSAIWPLLAIGGIVALVFALGTAFKEITYNNSIDKYKDDLSELESQLQDTENELTNVTSKIEETKDAISNIKKDGPLTLADEKQVELLQEQLDLLKQQEKILQDKENKNREDVLKSSSDLFNKQVSSPSETGISRAFWDFDEKYSGIEWNDQNEIQNIVDNARTFNDVVSGLGNKLQELKNQQNDFIKNGEKVPESITASIQYIEDILTNYQNVFFDFQESYLDASVNGVSEDVLNQYSEEYNQAKEYSALIESILDPSTYQKLRIADLIDTNSGLEDLKKKVDAFYRAFTEGRIDESALRNNINSAIEEAVRDSNISKIFSEEFGRSFSTEEIKENLKDGLEYDYDINLDSVNQEIEETVDYAEQAKSELEALNSSLDNIQSAYSSLSSAVDEYNQYGSLSLDTLQSVLSLDNSYLAALTEQNGQLSINTSSFAAKAAAELEAAKAASVDQAISELNALANQSMGESADVAATKLANVTTQAANLVPALGNAANAAVNAAKGLALIDSVQAASNAGVSQSDINKVLSGLNTKLNLINSTYNSMTSSINGATNALKGFGSAGSKAGSASKDAAEDATKALKEQYEAQKKVLEKQKEALEDQKEALEDQLDGLNDARDAIEDLIDDTMSMLKQQYEDEKDALDKQLEAFEDKINAQKDYLDLLKEEEEHQDELAEKNKNIADIQAQLEELRYDTSASGQAKRLELLDQLNDAQKELSDYQADYDYDTKQDALDKEYDSFKNQIDAQKDYIEEVLENERNLYLQAIQLIEGRSQEFYNNLVEWNRVYGTHVDSDIIQKWNLAYKALDEYGYLGVGVQGVLEGIANKCIDVENQNNAIEQSIKDIENQMSILEDQYNAAVEAAKKLADASNSARDAANDAISAYNQMQNMQNQTSHRLASGAGYSVNTLYQKPAVYHSGTDYVKPASSWLNKMLGLNEDETAAILKKGEAVIPDYANPFNSDNSSNNNFYPKSPSTLTNIPSSDIENNYRVEIGDIIVQGDADEGVVRKLNKVKDEIVNDVFKTYIKLQNIGGYKNTRLAH